MSVLKNGRAYLAFVLEKLSCRILELGQSLLSGQQEIEDMHDYYWQNYTEMDEYGYENYDNQQALLAQVNANQEQLLLRRRLKKMLDSPFFGRVDFCYEGEDEPETFYIGIGNFAERTGQVPLVYDWRSPVSGLFYDFDKGPASYMAPMGKLSGEITSKWQYKIRNGKMIYEFESDVKIDDEILQAELGANSEARLKNIIRTIQKEQNAIIRNTKDRILVIQGAAGSGKTSVALHRIAYLLYHDRGSLKSSNVLVLSPNSVFSDYISHILPELGEETIQEMSFDLFAYQQLQDTAMDCEDRFDQIERSLRGEPDQLYQLKQSQDFLDGMEGFFLSLEDDLMNFSAVEYQNVKMAEGEILTFFYERFASIPLLSRMDAIADIFTDRVETLKNADLPDEERAAILEAFRSMYETRDFFVLYNRFLESAGYPTLPDVPLEERILRYEDVYPILYMKCRLLRQKERQNIRHLIVDEMQDYTRLQYRILNGIFSCPMTILGDQAQTIGDSQQDTLAFLPGIFGKATRKIVMNKSYRSSAEICAYANRLLEITDIELPHRHGAPVQERVFPDLMKALISAVENLKLASERTSTAKNLCIASKSASTAKNLCIASKSASTAKNPDSATAKSAVERGSSKAAETEAYETAAVILLTQEEAETAYAILNELLTAAGFDTQKRLSLLHRDSQNFKTGLTVITFYLAKGLEFDQVFSIFPASDRRPLVRQAKYIAATRALHELHVYEIMDFSRG